MSYRSCVGLICMFVVSSAAVAQSSEPPAEILKVVEDYDKAILNQDAEAYDRLLSDDFQLIDWDGSYISKATIVAQAKEGIHKLEVAKSENNRFKTYGDTVIWTGDWTEKGTSEGKPVNKKGRFTTVLKKMDGEWKVVSDQVTEQSTNIEGAWKLHGRINDGGEVIQRGDEEGLIVKFISGGHWSVTYSDPGGEIQFHHGGTYTHDGNKYVESIKFANESTSSMVGSTFEFNLIVDDDVLTQKGLDNSFNEVWHRLKK